MKKLNTKKMVLTAILAALAMILNLIEIPYPIAPWLNFDLSEIVVLISVSVLGWVPTLFVCIMKGLISVLVKGPVGPIAIGQITAFIGSMTIATLFYLTRKKMPFWTSMLTTMVGFAGVMVLVNYLFVTPTYIMQKPMWFTQLPFTLNIDAFNGKYGSDISIPGFIQFGSAYFQAIFIIYFPFNFLKGIITSVVYIATRRVEDTIKL